MARSRCMRGQHLANRCKAAPAADFTTSQLSPHAWGSASIPKTICAAQQSWPMLLEHLESSQLRPSSLRRRPM